MNTTHKVTGQIAGRTITPSLVRDLRDVLYAAARAPGSRLVVDGRPLDIGALPVAVACGDREPTAEELAAALV